MKNSLVTRPPLQVCSCKRSCVACSSKKFMGLNQILKNKNNLFS